MNDAFRGVVMVGAFCAFYFALRLAHAHLWPPRDRRKHIQKHALCLTLALGVTAGLIACTLGEDTGQNSPLSWVERARLVQVSLLCVGLRPLWSHQRTMAARRAVRDTTLRAERP